VCATAACTAFDALSKSDAITEDCFSGGYSFNGGFRQRDQVDDNFIKSHLDCDFRPPHLRQRDLSGGPDHARLLAATGPMTASIRAAIDSCAPFISQQMDAMLRTRATAGVFAYPPVHLQDPSGSGVYLGFPEAVWRLKGGPDHLLSITGGHSDSKDAAFGLLSYWRPGCAVSQRSSFTRSASTRSATVCAPVSEHVMRLGLQMRLRGGDARAFMNAAMSAVERTARVRENARRRAAGIAPLPPGLWPADFPQPAVHAAAAAGQGAAAAAGQGAAAAAGQGAAAAAGQGAAAAAGDAAGGAGEADDVEDEEDDVEDEEAPDDGGGVGIHMSSRSLRSGEREYSNVQQQRPQRSAEEKERCRREREAQARGYRLQSAWESNMSSVLDAGPGSYAHYERVWQTKWEGARAILDTADPTVQTVSTTQEAHDLAMRMLGSVRTLQQGGEEAAQLMHYHASRVSAQLMHSDSSRAPGSSHAHALMPDPDA
jgi:hypothetical protein